MDKLELKALGKINLGLDVLRRREDGYHEVRMIMQTVHIYDRILLEKQAEGRKKLLENLQAANTLSDSYTAINKFFWVVNSWNIDYRWNKKRNPVLNAGTIILPCIYDMSPFLGAPVEHARCYMAEDFDGYRRTVKDKWFETLSKVLWKFKLDIKPKLIDAGCKVLQSNKMPAWLLNILVRTKIRTFWIHLRNL